MLCMSQTEFSDTTLRDPRVNIRIYMIDMQPNLNLPNNLKITKTWFFISRQCETTPLVLNSA